MTKTKSSILTKILTSAKLARMRAQISNVKYFFWQSQTCKKADPLCCIL